ncbi:MAG: tetratricopeptide repeat protein [Nitrosomonadales bacterium]|nr:tetratricopeptide repeat protein [Nitrosomonadales bacterium]
MSLLLNARRKSQQAAQPEAGTGPDTAAPQNADQARNAGQNLFKAKSLLHIPGSRLPNRKLLYALGGTILLLAGGLAYLWYLDSASGTMPLRPISAPPPRQAPPAAAIEPAMQNAPAAAAGKPEKIQPAAILAESPPAAAPQPRAPARPEPIRIEPKKTVPVDALLSDAYLAYSNGRLDEARRLYLNRLERDARNPDVLLGLAAIAQQRGEPGEAAQYFGRVLALDPRNALANAGMSALSTDEDYSESRLKILLREQGDSAVLHFALGNLYAAQSRWGEAQQAYFDAYTLEPGNAEYAFNLAVSLDHLGQRKPAAQHYQRAMQLDPSHSAGFDHTRISQRAQELTH